ncbi:MAG: Co2+/Mg2+ efflux protein ApaG [Gammaproteobacteria bacterium]|nr:Co2+/Mg2+ efflux protein ApaG [Gammaproteobacteria bacterium]MBT3489093.1 Co2+/Mg2+ efflux protein ApaG [Gammaproteobacteria bacterium]MBT3719110.1 Co2+/Mg2+ efflux protein ApaG [Gammaproteobacteria bacterium]MBT3843556.1 Co2+/Mg2+ efflux protein ApaG [Gammaproteobacteria bacterium]MBT3892744.1 Co2+/Mg2+ efflux protein ApaG [Gammaproteobacteria bacterium]
MKDDIHIHVTTEYVAPYSNPKKREFRFAYTILIENHGTVGAQLLRRHWLIRDDNGKVQEVRGEGVVGEQPYLEPGEQYQYSSGAMLETPHGTMEGSYEWVDEQQALFTTPISPFYLTVPRVLH